MSIWASCADRALGGVWESGGHQRGSGQASAGGDLDGSGLRSGGVGGLGRVVGYREHRLGGDLVAPGRAMGLTWLGGDAGGNAAGGGVAGAGPGHAQVDGVPEANQQDDGDHCGSAEHTEQSAPAPLVHVCCSRGAR